MPVFNGETYLERTVQSVLRQTFRHFEFLIVNDGSTDRTPTILRRLAAKDRRIKVLHNDPNQGIVRSLNKGLKAAQADLIARIDCGDICNPERLELQYGFFKKNPDHVLLGTQVNRTNEMGRIVGRTSLPESDQEIREALFCRRSVIAHPSAMYRKLPGLFYRENAYPSEDYDFWLRLSEKGRVAILPRHLVDLVNDPGSISHKHMIKQIVITGRLRNLLMERLRHGKEKTVLTDLRKENHWGWTAATWLYGYKIRRGYYRYHPMNFLINLAMTLLNPGSLIPRTRFVELFRIFHPVEFSLFCSLPLRTSQASRTKV